MFIRTSIFALYFLLVGCAQKVIITPDILPDAVVGEIYYADIEINGGSGPISAGGFKSTSTSNRLWVEPNPKRKGGFYNSLIVHGKPMTTGTITIKISGDMIPTGWRASSEFEKTYVIKVKEKE